MFGAPVITSSGYCSHLMPEIGAAIDRFRKMLRMQCRKVTVGSPPCPTIPRSLLHRARVPAMKGVLNEYNDLHIAGAGIRPNCLPQYREFIDFLVLNDDAVGAKLQGSFAETTFTGDMAEFPSDHCPIAIDIDLGRL